MSPPTFIYRRRISTLHKAYFDGGFWGTPGPMTIKFIVYDAQGHPIQQFWKRLGHGTNNIAEYLALLGLMGYLEENKIEQIQILGDSRLVINQVMGEWQVNKPHLADLAAQAQTLMRSHRGWRLSWIPRELNTADGIGAAAPVLPSS